MVNPVHLRTLLEVLRLGSFASAATSLGYTASAVSQQMAALERDTGVVLFRRSARAIEATEAASVIARHARRVLTDLEALTAAGATAAAGQGGSELRIGLFPSLASHVLPRLLADAAWQRLGLSLRLSVGEPHQTIHALQQGGELDVALVFQVGQAGLAWPSSLERQWLGDDPFRVVLPAAWGIRSGAEVTADQLANMPWLLHHPGTPDATVISRLFAAVDLHPRVVAYCDDFNASLRLAAAGLGAALVPQLALQEAPDGVVLVDVPEIRLARGIFALRPGGRGPGAPVDVLLERISAELRLLRIGG
ncbi:LysR family transcriptional regulator [Zafaria sp. Z1313]|uniref:LysR family transcriptional regulator n=1 Tax=unclassified Zafaria TaxID=2828765 RepID=UPI002E75CE18|nr:LysR family transcriptional regulator [Zafaria sp. J156]MEE1621563.1 LysR family transcriptional regulator [Zafaria sp. J156]